MLMKGVKKCGLLSAFFIIFGLSLVVSLDVNATYHNIVSFPLASFKLPNYQNNQIGCFSFNESKDRYEFNPNYDSCQWRDGSHFSISFQGDSYDSSLYDDLASNSSLSYVQSSYNDSDNSCTITGEFLNDSKRVQPILYFDTSSHDVTAGSDTSYSSFYFRYPFDTKSSCHHRSVFGDNHQGNKPSLNNISGYLTCNRFNGAVCDGIWDSRNYISSEIFPYWYGQDAVLLQDHYKADNGISYSNVFSLNQLFNKTIHKFSNLTIPINDVDDYYFYNPDNLYSGRHFEIRGSFDFEGSFSWHDNISNNGSYFRLYYGGVTANPLSQRFNQYVNCDTNLISISGLTRLEYSCPFDLDSDYIYLDLLLSISGNGNYVWVTNDDWTFNTTALISDYDDTPGRSFGKNITGGASKKIGSAQNNANFSDDDIVIDGANFSQSLIQLFGFSFLNPFAPLLQMFSDNNQCVQIPTLAGMIHSESTEVCPWFDSSVRNISTPVLSISSMMLIFGFSIRWLGSRSGNFIEDSESHESAGISVGKRGRK